MNRIAVALVEHWFASMMGSLGAANDGIAHKLLKSSRKDEASN